MEDTKLTKFANGGTMGISNDQLEIYKVRNILGIHISVVANPNSPDVVGW